MNSPRWAVVSGGSRGIGAAAARALADDGFQVVVVGRNAERTDGVASSIQGHAVIADLGEAGAAEAVLQRVEEIAGGSPAVVVNGAGVFDLGPMTEASDDVLDRNIDVNLKGAFRLTRSFLPGMLAAGRGLLVHIGSVSGRKAFPHNSAYAASKFGMRGFHEVLVEELRGTGVKSSLVEPGPVDTSIWDPMNPDETSWLPNRADMLLPQHVGDAVAFLARQPDQVNIPLLQIGPA